MNKSDAEWQAAADEVIEATSVVDDYRARQRETIRTSKLHEHGADRSFNVNKLAGRAFTDDVRADEPLQELRGRVEAGLEADRFTPPEVAEAAVETLARVEGDKRAVARLMIATGNQHYRSAFAKYMQGAPHLIDDVERQAITRAQAIGTGAAGAFAVPFTLDPTIIGITASTKNPIRSVARVVQTFSESWNGVTGTAVSFSWDAEATEVSDDSITLAQPSIPVHKLTGFVPFSIEVGQDWAGIEADLRRMMMEGRDNAEGAAHVTGTGSGQPTGIVTELAGGSSEINEASAGTFTGPDVYAALNALNERYLDNATWAMSLPTANAIRQLDTSGGGNFWVSLGGGAPESLLGLPHIRVNNMDSGASLSAGDNYVVIVGDWSRYVIVDRIGLQIEMIPHLFATGNNRPSGQRGLYAFLRTGAESVDDNAFSLLNVTV